MNEYLMIGEVLKPQGIKGEVKVKPFAANHDDFRRWKTLYIKQGESYAPVKASCQPRCFSASSIEALSPSVT